MTAPLRPQRLRAGARIGAVSPAYWVEPERLQRATAVFEGLGYEVAAGRNIGLRDNKYAGPPEARAEDIMAMFEDPSIDCIVCARGGYGGNRVLPLLDYETIRRHPKIFVGFSDITGLLNSFAQKAGLVTFHGPVLTSFGQRSIAYNLDTFREVLSGRGDVRVASPGACRARCLRPGVARGPLLGGNLSLIVERLGTPDQIDTAGAILLIEDVDEKLHAFDRMLLQLRNSGSLDRITGLLIGELVEMRDGEVPFGKSTDEIVLDVCGDLGIPIVSNFPCGHGDCQATLPIAHELELHANPECPEVRIPTPPVT